MTFHVITLFPESFDSYTSSSIIGRAVRNKKIKIKFYNPRDFTEDKHRRVDQKPYGGGPGMVLEASSVIKAVEKAIKGKKGVKIIWLTPSGKQFDNNYAQKTAKKYTDIIIISGRYEGIDARVKKIFKTEEISVGPFVLTGGELPAEILIDCISRQAKGVLGNFDSLEESRTASPEVYTRPEILEYKGKKYRVPKILLSGDHKKIEEWKKKRK
jgi:tRNA (guanine37-N1)-methyltransferase